MSKTYTYMVFLRNPTTKDVQQGTIEIDSDGEFLDFHELIAKISLDKNMSEFNTGHTLIGFNIVSVEKLPK